MLVQNLPSKSVAVAASFISRILKVLFNFVDRFCVPTV